MPFIKGCKWTNRQREECGFKKGMTPWNKGKKSPYSEDTLKMMHLAKVGNPGFWLGKKHSKETIAKLREVAKNHPNRRGPKGKPWSLMRKIAQEKRNGLPYKKSEFRKEIRIAKKSLIKNGKEYSFNWHEIRKQIYKRDGWICQECGVHCHNKQQIQCHHINYNTTNNVFSNLITLCVSCHMKTNFKREDWIKHYKNIIGVRGLIISEN